ncbi:MAG TPA: HEAT repeat domain-containing protein [Longimicrobiaceae bacterium]
MQITCEEAFWPRAGVHGERLIELMGMSQEEFSRRFKNSPVKRTKRRGLLRNVAVALGNWGSPEAVPVLEAALEDEEPLVRGHAAWALGRIGTAAAVDALQRRAGCETDEWVLEEIQQAVEEARTCTFEPVAKGSATLRGHSEGEPQTLTN